MTTAETDQTKKRNGADWRSVDIVFADGSTGPAKAAYSGDGWCDVAVERGGIFYRLWVRANGEVDLPMNPCRLAKPWTAIGAVSEASGAPETESKAVAEADPLVGLPEEERARILDIADKAGRMFGLDAERMAIAREVAAYCARQSSTCCAWHKSGGRKGEPCARHVATVAELAATPEPLTREETEADPLAGLPEAKRTRILREAGLADGPFSRQRAIAAGIAAFCAQVDILRGSRFTAELAAHGSAADTLSREEAEKSPAAKAETDLLATVPTEERARIVAVAEKASRDNPFECDRAYEAAVAREVAAWHVAHPVCENGCGRARVFGDYCGDCHNSNEPRWQSTPEKSAALPCPHHPVATERTPACTPADPCPEHRAVTREHVADALDELAKEPAIEWREPSILLRAAAIVRGVALPVDAGRPVATCDPNRGRPADPAATDSLLGAVMGGNPGFTEVPGIVFDVLGKLRSFVAPFANARHNEAAHLAETSCRACHAEAMLTEIEGAEAECRLTEKRRRPKLTDEQAQTMAVDVCRPWFPDCGGLHRDVRYALLRAARGETGPEAERGPSPGLTEEQAADLRERAAHIAETCSGGDHTISKRDLIAQRIRELPLRTVRRETDPASVPAMSDERAAKFGAFLADAMLASNVVPLASEASAIETQHDPIGLGEPFPVPMPDIFQGSPPGCPVPMPNLAPKPSDEEKQ